MLYIDAGTTVTQILDFIPSDFHLTVVTHNVQFISTMMEHPNIELILLPGTLNRRTCSVSDENTIRAISHYKFTKAFLGVSGITEDGRCGVTNLTEKEIKCQALEGCDLSYLLLDSSKFDESSLLSFASLSDINTVITDDGIPEGYKKYCKSNNIKLEIVEVKK